ncbi:conserved hypothetical protein [Vibrio chagasii]|nr:conserved hypothetical protein [Vibrio chagasii]CAH7364381.1 conserved hypothetical protein [Vibrio chagasii]
MIVSRREEQVYRHVQGGGEGWANIYANWFDNGVEILANSDYGVFGAYITGTGIDPKEFVVNLTFDKALKLFMGEKAYEYRSDDDYKKMFSKLSESAIAERRLGKEQAETVIEDINETIDMLCMPATLSYLMMNSSRFKLEELVPDYHDGEFMPKDVPSPAFCDFWVNCWINFTQGLPREQ